MAHDAYPANAVMQPVEGGGLELLEAHGNESGCFPQNPIEPVSETNVQAMGKEMSATEFPCVANQFIERKSDRRIVGSDNCASTRADDGIDGNVVFDKLLKDPDVTCATQASTAENDGDAYCRIGIASMGAADSSHGPR
jgi:hypothetical protein